MSLIRKLFGGKSAPDKPVDPPISEDQGRRMMEDLLDEMVASVTAALAARGQNGSPSIVYTMAAIAGQAAQMDAIHRLRASGRPISAPDIAVAEISTGRTYLLGDAIYRALIGRAEDPGVLWHVAGTAGIVIDDAVVADVFGHAAGTIGAADFGRPRIDAGVTPDLTIDQAVLDLRTVLPCFQSRGIGQDLWMRMTALAARHALMAAKPSETLGRMAIDAAVAGSRVRFEDIA